jgi:D-tyrosyl-tRNA(Tyr) deacylase
MRLLIQRVSQSSVRVDHEIVGEIGGGLLILMGVGQEDCEEDIEWLAKKTCNLRIFNDEEGRMNKSVLDVGGEILLVSQFTLLASTRKGNRPSYTEAAAPEKAREFYQTMAKELQKYLEKPVSLGKFGHHMEVGLINDGPVTIWLDSKERV